MLYRGNTLSPFVCRFLSHLCVIGSAVLLLSSLSVPASAQFLHPTTYAMDNGSSGSFSYHDATYNGSGNVNTNYAPLSGGVGYLTDDILAAPFWDTVVDGNNQSVNWVGWRTDLGHDPLITFDFGSLKTFTQTSLYLCNGSSGGVGGGGVLLPASVTFTFSNNGTTFGNTIVQNIAPDNSSAAARFVDVSTPVSARFVRADLAFAGGWIFLSEARFTGTAAAATPEPGSMALCAALGLGGLAALRRRKR